jgi:hypothetical protein
LIFFLKTSDDIWRGHEVSARSRGPAFVPFERRGDSRDASRVAVTRHGKIIKISKPDPNSQLQLSRRFFDGAPAWPTLVRVRL